MDRDVRLNIRCAGMINGEILTAEGKGVAPSMTARSG